MSKATELPGSPTPAAQDQSPARARILIVDDEPIFARVFVRSLQGAYQVTHEGAASSALRRIAEGETFDVVFCDLMMPKMTGMELYEEVLRLAPKLAPRIVFMTGGAFTKESDAFLGRVPNLRLSKPFRREELNALLASLL